MLRASSNKKYDIVFVGDLSIDCNVGIYVAADAACLVAAGYRIGFFHTPQKNSKAIICPEIQSIIHNGQSVVIEPNSLLSTKLMIGYAQNSAQPLVEQTKFINSEHAAIVLLDDLDVDLKIVQRSRNLTHIRFSALGHRTQTRIEKGQTEAVWPITVDINYKESSLKKSLKPLIGAIANSQDDITYIQNYSDEAELNHIVILRLRGGKEQELKVPNTWSIVNGSEASYSWFIDKIDGLILANTTEPINEYFLGLALLSGKPVLSQTEIDSQRGHTLRISDRTQFKKSLLAIWNDSSAGIALQDQLRAYAKRYFSTRGLISRIERMIGKPQVRKLSGRRHIADVPRVLFMPKGGVGVGHVMRSLAVARRASGRFKPIFATLSEQVSLIEDFGFKCEYFPSAPDAYVAQSARDAWLHSELRDLVFDYDIDAVIFDGSDPSPAILSAISQKNGCKLAWLRRGMWGAVDEWPLKNSWAFDLILEPGEIASSRDRGSTADRRDEAHQLNPIRLLDHKELLSRNDAAHMLGIDPSRPAVLIQLGSGKNRDILSITDIVIHHLRAHPNIQIVVAEWANSRESLTLWDGIKVIKGAPLSQYFHAFDFSIAAAGYNTFHEAIEFKLPTIFIPNAEPGMDDQSARSSFAQENGMAIELTETELNELPQILSLIVNDKFRSVMKANCKKFASKNGAAQAADLIFELVNSQSRRRQ